MRVDRKDSSLRVEDLFGFQKRRIVQIVTGALRLADVLVDLLLTSKFKSARIANVLVGVPG